MLRCVVPPPLRGPRFRLRPPLLPPLLPLPTPPAAPSLRNFVDLDSEGRVKAEERALLDRLQQTMLEGVGRTYHKTYFM